MPASPQHALSARLNDPKEKCPICKFRPQGLQWIRALRGRSRRHAPCNIPTCVAELLDRDDKTVERWIDMGIIEAVRFGGPTSPLMIAHDDLDAFILARKNATTADNCPSIFRNLLL